MKLKGLRLCIENIVLETGRPMLIFWRRLD